MKNDLDFLVSSEFSKVFNFTKNDPLLLKPSQVITKLKEKKIDHNYFIQHGQVIVSLPSSLKPKVDYAEEILGRETKLQSMLKPSQINELCDVIYEELCEEEVENDVQNYVLNNKPKFIQGVCENLVNEEIEDMVKDIVKESSKELNKGVDQKTIPLFAENFINTEVDKLLEEIIKEELKNSTKEQKENMIIEQRKNEENSNLARLIYNDLFSPAIQLCIEQTISEITDTVKDREKAYRLAKTAKENADIAEKIRNDYIEIIIKELTIDFSERLTKEKSKKAIADDIYNQLILDLLKETVTEHYSNASFEAKKKKDSENNDLSEKILEGLLDSLCIDLPEICVEANTEYCDMYTDKGELLENMGLQFPSNSVFNDLSSLEFKRISAPDSVFFDLIEEYYPKIPIQETNVTADIDKLEEITSEIEANYFWALIHDNIVGLLIFSVDVDRDDVRVINVCHLTCID